MNRPSVELFRLGPYVAVALSAAGFCLAAAWRGWRPPAAGVDGSRGWQLLGRGRLGRISFGLLLLGHLGAVLAPKAVLRWNDIPLRLYVLEGTGFVLGVLALLGLLGGLRRHLTESSRSIAGEIADAMLVASLLLAVATGLGSAVIYRWASSWGAAIMVPYVHALARGTPATALIAGTPWLAQLHVLAALWAIAVLPFSAVGTAMIAMVHGLVRAAAARAAVAKAALARRVPVRGWAAWLWPDEDLLDALAERRRQAAQRQRGRRDESAPSGAPWRPRGAHESGHGVEPGGPTPAENSN